VVYGLITADTLEQAIERAGTKAGNKGADAAVTALEMVKSLQGIEGEVRCGSVLSVTHMGHWPVGRR